MRRDEYTIRSDIGAIRIGGDALAGLVVAAAEGVSGARVRRPRRGLDIEVADTSVRVSVEVAACYGSVLPELGEAVQRAVAAALERAAGLAVRSVNVAIEELEE